MDKETVLTRIQEAGIVAVVRAETSEQAVRIADACMEGGVAAIELTFTVPQADKVIADLAKRYADGGIILGAGTVMDAATARIAILNGAQYVVSPYFDPETVKLCNHYRVPIMPGVMTVREAVMAMEAGADILKVFPGDVFGPKIIKAIRGPIPYAKMMPTGGVDVDNVADWVCRRSTKNGSKSEKKEEHLMKQYKVTIANGNYPLSCTCNTIADAYECLRSIANWDSRIEIDLDDLMVALVQMYNGDLLGTECAAYSITALEEADADANLD